MVYSARRGLAALLLLAGIGGLMAQTEGDARRTGQKKMPNGAMVEFWRRDAGTSILVPVWAPSEGSPLTDPGFGQWRTAELPAKSGYAPSLSCLVQATDGSRTWPVTIPAERYLNNQTDDGLATVVSVKCTNTACKAGRRCSPHTRWVLF